MAKTKSSKLMTEWQQTSAVRVSRIHFVYIAVYLLATVIFDTWNLYTHQAIAQLWTAAGVFLIANIIIWYLARMDFKNSSVYTGLIYATILMDIAFAGYNIYWQRGLASKSVVLFTVPIVVSAILRSRAALLATTGLCAAVYSLASVRYFFVHYGEGFRVELWGTVFLYSALFFVLAWILMVLVLPRIEKF